jgi:transposase-like protein
MKPLSFRRHRFPPEIIRHAIWLYARFTLSFRDVEELLAERGIALAACGKDYTLRTKRDHRGKYC